MPSVNDSTLQNVIDVQEIEQILYKYAVAVDARHRELMYELFTEDAHIDLSGTGIYNPHDYVEGGKGSYKIFDATQHSISTPVVQVTGDTAQSRCYFVAQHVRNSLKPNPCLVIGGNYDDELARTKDGWRITKRTGTATWYDGNPEVLNLPGVPGFPDAPGSPAWTEIRECPPWMRTS
jgi:3-phenylpropionate/cinnamic acid dioxygenase small subunit